VRSNPARVQGETFSSENERKNVYQSAASLEDLQVTELADELQVMLDEEHHLLLVDLIRKRRIQIRK
jgi:hypothetical protein